jgi:CRISPR-associated endonuclease Csn1
MKTLGLDIGSNSVGSAWVDTMDKTIRLGVSVFPAGVAETESKRGAPKNQARRETRSMTRVIRRAAERKRRLRVLLVQAGLLPQANDEFNKLVRYNGWSKEGVVIHDDKYRTVWDLRAEAMERELHPYEFGRVLVHLNQRRGALGVETSHSDEEDDSEDPKTNKKNEDGKIKAAIERLEVRLNGRTIGQFMFEEMQQRRTPISVKGQDKMDAEKRAAAKAKFAQGPIRNRRDSYEFHADRTMVRDEFNRIWAKQAQFGGLLAKMLTDELKKQLDTPKAGDIWREKGAIFGQRKTYWDTGTLGRCDLEPTDRCCPKMDMYAQHYRVIETVNNIKITRRGTPERALSAAERDAVIAALRKQKSGTVATVRKALKVDKQSLKKSGETDEFYSLNIERDIDKEINTDRFWREIVLGVFGEEAWAAMDERARSSVNQALLKFDKDAAGHEARLRKGARNWWKLDEEQIEALIKAWRGRGATEERMQMSRRAIRNILPYMDQFDEKAARWPTQIEAKQRFALDADAQDQSTGTPATPEQRVRYAHNVHGDDLREVLLTTLGGDEDAFLRLLKLRGSTKASRHFEIKHPNLLPPAPKMSNPVVRKAIHEVRRHVMAHIAAAGCKPDRIIIELAREARQSGKVRQAALDRNRNRNKIRKQITEDYRLEGLTRNQLRTAQDRVLLCRRQKSVCAYSRNDTGAGEIISERAAARGRTDDGRGLEIDHIVPYSRSGDDSLNNKVLCYTKQNRGKGSQTPREWWGEAFERNMQPLAFIEKYKPGKNEYFTKKDYARLWENLTRTVKPEDEWRKSNLTDTAYASSQVMNYLRDALFDGVQKSAGGRGVYETKGRYTSILRKDWELQDEDGKSRDDHRHHAVDAVVIALTDPYKLLPVLAKRAKDGEEYHDRTGYWPKRDPDPTRALLPKVWEDHLDLRTQVMAEREKMVVSHRPVKTKLVGAFHKQTQFGPIPGESDLFTNRIGTAELKPAHLRLPVPEKKTVTQKRLRAEWMEHYQGEGLSKSEATKRARSQVTTMMSVPGFQPPLVEPPTGKGGLVRDPDLRRRLRHCVDQWCDKQQNGRNASSFTKDDAKKMSESGAFCMQSGVPIRSATLLRIMNDPVVIPLRAWDHDQGRAIVIAKETGIRVFEGRNNHHISIRENHDGGWSGEVVPTFEVAQRIRMSQGHAVDRADDPEQGGRFIMSLAEGETVHMCHPDTHEPGYFVVFKLDKPRTIHFKWHTDSRLDGGRKNEGTVIESSKREDIAVVVSNLKKECSFPDGSSPIKVRVSPLGETTEVDERNRPVEVDLADLDPRVVAVATIALDQRAAHPNRKKDKTSKPLPGSWRWMQRQLEEQGIENLKWQLSPALHLLKEDQPPCR